MKTIAQQKQWLANTPILFLARHMWQFSAGRRWYVFGFLLLFAAANGFTFLEPLIVARLLNVIQESGLTSESIPRILGILALLLLADIGFWVFHAPARYLENINGFFVRMNYRHYLLEGVTHLKTSWHTEHHSGDTIDKIEKAASSLYSFSRGTFEIIQAIFRFVGSYIALVYFNIHTSYIIAIMVLVTMGTIIKFDKYLVQQFRKIFLMENEIAAKIYDVISNIITVIVLRIEQMVITSILKKMMEPFRLFRKNVITNEMKWFTVNTASTVTVLIVLFSYIYTQYRAGAVILAGTIYALYGYIQRINDTFYRFASIYNNIIQQKTAIENVEEITALFQKQEEIEQIPLSKEWEYLHIHSLVFSYHTHEGADLHLDNISLSIQHGEKIALIGASGSGKTTFLKIVRGLYTPQQLSLHVDDLTLSDGFPSISQDIALIPQEPEIFTADIRENITIGLPFPQEEIDRFVRIARFEDVLRKLPHGYESHITEKGVNLSGGQKQRLALSRGLLASTGKSILLFDEPTSSVDTRNELAIYKNIFTEFFDKTILSSIHRLHLLPLFDRILYFSDGKIIADGAFEELLQSSDEFRDLWNAYKKSHDTETH